MHTRIDMDVGTDTHRQLSVVSSLLVLILCDSVPCILTGHESAPCLVCKTQCVLVRETHWSEYIQVKPQ